MGVRIGATGTPSGSWAGHLVSPQGWARAAFVKPTSSTRGSAHFMLTYLFNPQGVRYNISTQLQQKKTDLWTDILQIDFNDMWPTIEFVVLEGNVGST